MDRQLRLVAADIVVSSEMTKAAKLQMLNFIKEDASDAQVKALLMDGKIVQLDEQAEEIVNERFKQSPLNEGGYKTILGFFLLSPGGWAMYRGVRAAIDEKNRRCGVLAIGRVRDICLWKVRAEESQKLAAVFKRELKNCAKAKNPEKCRKSGEKKIKELEAKAAKFLKKIQSRKNKNPKMHSKVDQGLKKAADKKGKLV